MQFENSVIILCPADSTVYKTLHHLSWRRALSQPSSWRCVVSWEDWCLLFGRRISCLHHVYLSELLTTTLEGPFDQLKKYIYFFLWDGETIIGMNGYIYCTWTYGCISIRKQAVPNGLCNIHPTYCPLTILKPQWMLIPKHPDAAEVVYSTNADIVSYQPSAWQELFVLTWQPTIQI